MNEINKREKFATQVDAAIIAELKSLAQAEGRQIQSVVEEALKSYLDAKSGAKPRSHVMKAYMRSHGKYAPLYKKLAQ